MLMPLKTGESGMTLIELTIVMVIIGLLAALVIPQFRGVVDDAKLKSAQSEIQVFESALQRYSIDVGDYPATEQSLIALWNADSLTSGNWRGPYVSKPSSKILGATITSTGIPVIMRDTITTYTLWERMAKRAATHLSMLMLQIGLS